MPLQNYDLRWLLLSVVIISLFLIGIVQPSVNDLPGFSDHTGPTQMTVTEFERLESGCAEDVADFARSRSGPNGTYLQTTFIETGDPTANLSVYTERTSPRGADLSTFRVHVESHPAPENVPSSTGTATETDDTTSNTSCRLGVQYRLTVRTSGGSPEGFLPDAHGTRILWLENGEYAGCSGGVTSPLESSCHRLAQDPQRTWANATVPS